MGAPEKDRDKRKLMVQITRSYSAPFRLLSCLSSLSTTSNYQYSLKNSLKTLISGGQATPPHYHGRTRPCLKQSLCYLAIGFPSWAPQQAIFSGNSIGKLLIFSRIWMCLLCVKNSIRRWEFYDEQTQLHSPCPWGFIQMHLKISTLRMFLMKGRLCCENEKQELLWGTNSE